MIGRFAALTLCLLLTACSAIEMDRQRSAENIAAETAIAATVERTVAAALALESDARATAQALANQITQQAATMSAEAALVSTASPAPASTGAASAAEPRVATGAEVSVYGDVPIDSDRLNIIAALAVDSAGDLLVAKRAGEIYRLRDTDGDGTADVRDLIFADDMEQLGPVSGLIARGGALLLLTDGRLSQLLDGDGDGVYETVAELSAALPAEQMAQQAGNGIVEAPDGSIFSADISTGQLLKITLSD